MTASALLDLLRARGIEIFTDGRRVGVRPAGALTDGEREELRRQKAAVLLLLSPPAPATWERPPGRWSVIVGTAIVDLDPATVAETLGPGADEHDLGGLKFDIGEAIARYQAGVRAGQLPPRLLVRGLPLCDWLSLDDVARLLREGAPR